MAMDYTLSMATGVLTFTGQPLNTETVVIAGKTYTFQSALTDSDGNVAIGATTAESVANLAAAIDLGAGAGTAYAASMTRNPEVAVVSSTATVLTVGAPGAASDRIPTTETLTNASWGGATLSGGAGSIPFFAVRLLKLNQINAEVTTEIYKLTAAID